MSINLLNEITYSRKAMQSQFEYPSYSDTETELSYKLSNVKRTNRQIVLESTNPVHYVKTVALGLYQSFINVLLVDSNENDIATSKISSEQ